MDKLPHYFLQLRQKADPVQEFLSPESISEAYQIQHKNILTTKRNQLSNLEKLLRKQDGHALSRKPL